ncbi:MAG: hypothetical protein AAB353_11485, partial [Candidatus Hydrogenedentota bacterium]
VALGLPHAMVYRHPFPGPGLGVRILGEVKREYADLLRRADAIFIEELRAAPQSWPGEIGLHEQLARDLEASGDKTGAASEWEKVSGLNPDHAFATRAMTLLRDHRPAEKRKAGPARPRASAPSQSTFEDDRACPSCGAKNGSEFERCWQCHALLRAAARAADQREETRPSAAFRPAARSGADLWPMFLGFTIVACLSAGLYFTLRTYVGGLPAKPEPASSLHTFLDYKLNSTRLIIGLVLLIAWPVCLHLAARLANIDRYDGVRLTVIGITLATLVFASSWLILAAPALVIAAPILASFLLVFFAAELKYLQALRLWALQGALATLVLVTAFTAIHSFDFVRDFPFLLSRLATRALAPTFEQSGVTPVDWVIEWVPSESDWLDRVANTALITVEPGAHQDRIFVEITGVDKKTLEFREVNGAIFTFDFEKVRPGQPFHLLVSGKEAIPVRVKVESVFTTRTSGSLPSE